MASCRAVAVGSLLAVTLCTAAYLLAFTSPARGTGPCRLDDEGSWSIGLFRGSSPLNLTPVEKVQPRLDSAAAWPVANPILTCASVVGGAPSNFVADPFLWVQPNGSWYIFFETKTNTDMQGDIGVAESTDGGASWRYLGLALDEPWHLSYPFVFQWNGEMFMVPEGYGSGQLRLYRTTEFPLRWELHRVLLGRPLIDTSLFEWEGRWWMLTSDVGRRGATKNGELEAYHAPTPLGPWAPHALNPLMNGDRRAGARMAGRVVPFEGGLLRFGQDCGETYGHRVVAYRIERLTPTEFRQAAVPFEFGQSRQGRGAWNGMRHHHVDAAQLPDGGWVAVMDGDSQPSGPISSKLRGAGAVLGALWGAALAVAGAAYLHVRSGGGTESATGLRLPTKAPPHLAHLSAGRLSSKGLARALLGLRHAFGSWAARQLFPGSFGRGGASGSAGGLGPRPRSRTPSPCPPGQRWWSGGSIGGGGFACAFCAAGSAAAGGYRAACRRVGISPSSAAARWGGFLLLAALLAAVLALTAAGLGAWYFLSIWWERPSAAAAVPVGGQLSKFSLVTMTYAARLPTLRLIVQHYSKCPSVAEIVVVWNSGPPPDVDRDLPGAALPVRVRVEGANSLNNRFRSDPLLRTRAMLQLDDDLLLRCADVERGFAAWRRQPDRLVGFFPRLVHTRPLEYLGEGEVFRRGRYNALLTGALFMDAQQAARLYWSEANAAARAVVDRLFNCEDVLLNFLWAAETVKNQQAEQGAGQPQGGANHSMASGSDEGAGGAVLYVRPRRRLDISALSRVGISRKTGAHLAKRLACAREFEGLFGGNPLRTERVLWTAQDRPPLCSLPGLGCVYL